MFSLVVVYEVDAEEMNMISVNGYGIKPTIFPDKTSQVWKLDKSVFNKKKYCVEWIFEYEAELIHIAQLVDLIRSFGHYEIYLKLTYLPYARQDKEITNESTFALRTFANLLNKISFKRVDIFDPHSHLSTELINHSHAIWPKEETFNSFKSVHADIVAYPDRGAIEKYEALIGLNCVYGEKVRDQITGNILHYKLHGDVKDKNVLIVDDICDGGATFVFLAKALKEAGAKSVHLYVSHGLFTKGLQVLKDAGIERIFTKEGEIK